jgi:hypothetical protein
MIINEFVNIEKKGNNKLEYYKNLGYNISGDIIKVRVNDLLENSKYIILTKCEFCNNTKEITYKNYIRNKKRGNRFSCSKKCSIKKTKESNLEKYGETSHMKTSFIKEKIKKTNLEKYGVFYTFQSEEVKEKIKESNLERWGVENPFESNLIKERIKETNLERWGVENPSQLEEVKNKVKKTCLEKWDSDSFLGSEFFLSNKEIKEKSIKNRMLTITNELYREKYDICKDINYIKYLANSTSLFKCDKGHNFEITSDNYRGRKINNTPLCTVCNPIGDSQSIKEKELYEFLQSIYNGEITQSYRDGLEIDIYLPDLKLGFEFNGLWWHSEKFKDKDYHINKTKYFKERGIRIIHIWEDDWDFKKNIIKSQIRNWLNLTEGKIFARKCYVKEIKDSKISSKFLEENHIQGKVGSSLKLGLYFEKELVSLMTFDHYEGRKKMEDGGWNINRFCNKLNTNIIGGSSKILKYFIKNYDVKRIISYADRDWSEGSLYEKLGFEKVSESNPDYKYIFECVRVHKSRFRKSKLNTNLTETQYMEKSHILKIWDCGKNKYELCYTKENN